MPEARGKAEVSSEEGFISDRLSLCDQNKQPTSRGKSVKMPCLVCSVWRFIAGVVDFPPWGPNGLLRAGGNTRASLPEEGSLGTNGPIQRLSGLLYRYLWEQEFIKKLKPVISLQVAGETFRKL